MKTLLQRNSLRRAFSLALPLAFFLTLLVPMVASAHAILLRSDPAKDAVLSIAPQQVRMWFSESLNPAFTTAVVVDASNKRVDKADARVSASDNTEMDVSLRPNLPPAVYIVVYRTDSADDGHILRGSFIFSIANADGTVPTLPPGSNPGQNELGSGNPTGLYTGQIDPPTLFNLIMITLVEMGAIFWMAAQLWANFVLSGSAEAHKEERSVNSQVQQRFERRFSLPTLGVLVLANVGVLYGQALNLTSGDWLAAASPSLLAQMATSGRFGTYWLLRVVVLLVALLLGLYMVLSKRRPRVVNSALPLANLFLGSVLLIAITMSGHAAAVSANIVTYAVVIDWLHLLAASLWVGGMLYIVAIYLPVLQKRTGTEQARSLVTILPYFSPLAIGGVLLMAVTGPFSATFHLTSWEQFLTTAYGRALLVKIALVGSLLAVSAFHVGLLRPRLKKEYKKYNYAQARLQAAQAKSETTEANGAEETNQDKQTNSTDRATELIAQQVRLRDGRLSKGSARLVRVLRWEPLLGVAVLVCVGLMNVFAGTLSPIAAAQQQPAGQRPAPLNITARTTDGKFTLKMNVNPNRFGTNVFTVNVIDNSTGKPTTNVGVSLYTTMLDMAMGTDTVNLQSDGKGGFSASGDLAMPGNWQVQIQVRTLDNQLHNAIVKFVTPF